MKSNEISTILQWHIYCFQYSRLEAVISVLVAKPDCPPTEMRHTEKRCSLLRGIDAMGTLSFLSRCNTNRTGCTKAIPETERVRYLFGMTTTIVAALVCGFSILNSQQVNAAPVSYGFSGTIANVSDPNGYLGGTGIVAGSSKFAGSFTYDPANGLVRSSIGTELTSWTISQAQVSVDKKYTVAGDDKSILVANNSRLVFPVGPVGDALSVGATSSRATFPSSGDSAQSWDSSWSLYFRDTSGTAFKSTSLPQQLSLSSFDSATFSLGAYYDPNRAVQGVQVTLDGNVTKLYKLLPPPPPPSAYQLLRNSISVFDDTGGWTGFTANYDVPTMSSVVAGVPAEGSKGIGATFTPNSGYSLAAAAGALGYDHFNWMQWVTVTDGSLPTFIDPPIGCYDYLASLLKKPCKDQSNNSIPANQNRDFLPYYLDEEFSLGGTRIYDSSGQRKNAGQTRLEQWTADTHTLLFSDSPNVDASFHTCLVGVRADGTQSVFGANNNRLNSTCFDWVHTGFDNLLLRTEEGGGTAGSSLFLGFRTGGFTPDEELLLARYGVDIVTMPDQVPEPPSILLVLLGLGIVSSAFSRPRDRVAARCIRSDKRT